jgi:D-lactate dehydrogenase
MSSKSKTKIALFEISSSHKVYFKKALKKYNIVFFNEKIDKNCLPKQNNFEIISPFVGSKMDKEVIAHFPNLKLIAARSTGVDHIDLKECQKKGIKVANVPVYGDNTVAEHTFALILTLSRKIFKSFDQIKETGSFSLKGMQGFDLKNKVLGVIGTGNIGRYVIGIARGFQMKVLAFDVYPDEKLAEKLDFKYTKTLEELLKKSDIVTLHVPLNAQTRHLINKNNIYKIKKGALLINTARGGIMETEALLKALKDKHLAGVGLDVLEGEKAIKEELEIFTTDKYEVYDLVEEYKTKEKDLKVLVQNRILVDMENVIITPHNAFNSKEALQRICEITLENINSFIENNPQNIVN